MTKVNKERTRGNVCIGERASSGGWIHGGREKKERERKKKKRERERQAGVHPLDSSALINRL